MVNRRSKNANSNVEHIVEFLGNVQRGVKAGIITLNDDETRITYHCSRIFSVNFKNPEEKVRASYFVELVLDYQYDTKFIDLEITVPRRTPEDRADIIVYEDIERKKPYLVVECKKDGITDAEFRQAIEQAFGNANSIRSKFSIVVAGNTKTAFDVAGFKPNEREKNVIADIPVKFGIAPKYRYIKGDKEKDVKVVSREELIRTLEKCHDSVWQGGRLTPTNAFDEVSKLLFCKIKDEKDGTKRGESYKFQVGTHETADEVYARVNSIYLLAQEADPDVFQNDVQLDSKVVYSVVEHLQGLALNKIDLDTKGVAFERFMQDFFKGKMGQFFTPRQIVEFCVEMLTPKHNDLVLDPACGSGGFLLYTLDAIRKFAEQGYEEREAWDYWHKFAMNNLFGIEINDQIARVCKMNMILHDDGHTNVISTDSLDDYENITSIHKGFKKNHFDLILTNPPFGAVVKETEHDYLGKYVFGKDRKNQKSEILFIERCVDFVKAKTGKIGIVLPDSIVVNSSLQYVRDFILQNTKILAIVSLPDFTFSHYGANVKSSLLFLQKFGDRKTSSYPVFMASAEKVGYTATGKEDIENDLTTIAECFQQFLGNPNKLSIPAGYEEKIFIINSSDFQNDRMDVKGHSKKFKDLRQIIINQKPTLSIKDCLIDSMAGDWGLDPNTEENVDDYVLCYVLRNTNFDNEFNIDSSDIALRYIKRRVVAKLQLKNNEILVEKSGGSPYQPVGRVAFIQNLPTDKPVIFSNFLQKIQVNPEIAHPAYVFTYLKTLYQMGYMEFIQNQTTGIKNLLMDEFYEIPLVTIDEDKQKEIAKKYLGEMMSVKDKIDSAYQELDNSREEARKKIFG